MSPTRTAIHVVDDGSVIACRGRTALFRRAPRRRCRLFLPLRIYWEGA